MSLMRDPVSLFRRQLAVSTIAQNGLLLLAGVGLALAMAGAGNAGFLMLGGIAIVWSFLGYRSMRASAGAGEVPGLIAAGNFAEAEDRIDQGLRHFSLFRATRLMGLHQLVLLRHAQRRFGEAAVLARVLLMQKLGGLRGVSNSTQILLAESLMELGDLRGAYDAIAGLYQRRLALREALGLLRVQLEYSARIGAWGEMLNGIREKVRMCELMPAGQAMRAELLLAEAAERGGRGELAAWLRERAGLLATMSVER